MVNMSPSEAFNECLSRGERIPELEDVISTNSYFSYLYARDVIKNRFIEGEKSIATDLECSYYYAHDVLKGPFHLGHPIIFKSYYKNDYLYFLKYIKYDLNEIGEWLI